MKKLMCAVAAVAAGVAFAEEAPAVASANVVGYYNRQLAEAGQQMMISGAFVSPGTEKYWMSDIKITGYQYDIDWVENGAFGASLYVLDSYGRCKNEKDCRFAYSDVCDSWDEEDPTTAEWSGGYWKNNGVAVTPHGANDLELDAGDAVWFTCASAGEGCEQYWQSSGEVLNHDYKYELVEGQQAIGNPMPCDVWLSDMMITGYQFDQDWVENGAFGTSFYIKDGYGRCLNQKDCLFAYSDVCDSWDEEDPKTAEWSGGYWKNNGVAVVPHGEGDYKFKPGEGIWLTGAHAAEGCTQYLIFKTPVPAAK